MLPLTRIHSLPSSKQVWNRQGQHVINLTEGLQRQRKVQGVVVLVARRISPKVVVLVQAFQVETFQNIILRRDILMRNIKDNSRRKRNKEGPVVKS